MIMYLEGFGSVTQHQMLKKFIAVIGLCSLLPQAVLTTPPLSNSGLFYHSSEASEELLYGSEAVEEVCGILIINITLPNLERNRVAGEGEFQRERKFHTRP